MVLPQSLVRRVVDQVYDWIVDKLPRRVRYPVYRESATPQANDYAEVTRALSGEGTDLISTNSGAVSHGELSMLRINVETRALDWA